MNRRKFIRNSSSVILPALLNGFSVKAFGHNHLLSSILKGTETGSDRVLVLVQLFGGNDGLNTVIPISVYNKYHNARANIAIPEKKILPLTGITEAGLHPSLEGLRDLYNDGKLSILHSVGYPSTSFSHFRSSDIWMSGSDAEHTLNTGWIARYLAYKYPDYPVNYPNAAVPDPLAIQFGTATSFIFQGEKTPVSVNIADPHNIYNIAPGFMDPVKETDSGRELNFIRFVAAQAQAYGQVVKQAADRVEKQLTYPDTSLAAQLKIVAGLIKGGLKTKVYLVSYEGFDTHGQQVNAGNSSTGIHADLLKTTGDAIKAFQDDLEFLNIADRVTGMTFSEFGRRIASNDSLGTDHGAGAPLFVFGAKVRGGMIGKTPDIPEKVSNEDNVELQFDFRAVYATMLSDWMMVPRADTDKLLFKSYDPLQFIRSNNNK